MADFPEWLLPRRTEEDIAKNRILQSLGIGTGSTIDPGAALTSLGQMVPASVQPTTPPPSMEPSPVYMAAGPGMRPTREATRQSTAGMGTLEKLRFEEEERRKEALSKGGMEPGNVMPTFRTAEEQAAGVPVYIPENVKPLGAQEAPGGTAEEFGMNQVNPQGAPGMPGMPGGIGSTYGGTPGVGTGGFSKLERERQALAKEAEKKREDDAAPYKGVQDPVTGKFLQFGEPGEAQALMNKPNKTMAENFRMQALAAENAAALGTEKAQTEFAQKKENDRLMGIEEKKQQTMQDEQLKAGEAAEAGLSAAIDEYDEMKIDPQDFFQDSRGVFAAIGVALGAIGQAFQQTQGNLGAQNQGVVAMNKAIDRDMMSQRLNIDKSGKKIGMQRNLMSAMYQRFGNEQAAELATRAMLEHQGIRALDLAMGQYVAPEKQAALQAVKAGLGIQEADSRRKLNEYAREDKRKDLQLGVTIEAQRQAAARGRAALAQGRQAAQAKAAKGGGGKPIPPGGGKRLGDIIGGFADIKRLEKDFLTQANQRWTTAGAWVGESFPSLGTESSRFRSQSKLAARTIGKKIEGGLMTDPDVIDYYENAVPKATDLEETGLRKVRLLKDRLYNQLQGEISGMRMSGLDVAPILARPEVQKILQESGRGEVTKR